MPYEYCRGIPYRVALTGILLFSSYLSLVYGLVKYESRNWFGITFT